MKSKLRSALDKVQATDDLKNNTVDYLMAYKKVNVKTSKNVTPLRFKFALICASLLLFIFVGGVSYHLYFTSTSYVDMDANPSIGLIVNRFGRVINVQAYNEEGTRIVNDVNTRFMRYDDAVERLIDRIILKEYLSEEFVAVTVQTDSYRKEKDMLIQIERVVVEALAEHKMETRLEVFSVVEDIRVRAHEHQITPARYLAIIELKAVEPSITIQCYDGYSIGYIRERARRRARDCENSEDETSHCDSEYCEEGTSRCNDIYCDNIHCSHDHLEQPANCNKPNNEHSNNRHDINKHNSRGYNRNHSNGQDRNCDGSHGNNHAGSHDRNHGVDYGNNKSNHGQCSNQTGDRGGNHNNSDGHHGGGQRGNYSSGNDNNHNSECRDNRRGRR